MALNPRKWSFNIKGRVVFASTNRASSLMGDAPTKFSFSMRGWNSGLHLREAGKLTGCEAQQDFGSGFLETQAVTASHVLLFLAIGCVLLCFTLPRYRLQPPVFYSSSPLVAASLFFLLLSPGFFAVFFLFSIFISFNFFYFASAQTFFQSRELYQICDFLTHKQFSNLRSFLEIYEYF